MGTKAYMEKYNRHYYELHGAEIRRRMNEKRGKIRASTELQIRSDAKLKARNAELKHRYGITADGVREAFIRQGGRCACGDDLALEKTNVDHDHQTEEFRGLLHKGCNLAIAFAHDDPLRLRLLAEYLEIGLPDQTDFPRAPFE